MEHPWQFTKMWQYFDYDTDAIYTYSEQIADLPDIVSKSVSSRPKSSVSETDPYAGTVFIPDTCRLLEQISVSEDRLSGVKMSQLFADIAEPDQKVSIISQDKGFQKFAAKKNQHNTGDPIIVSRSVAKRKQRKKHKK